MYLPSRYEIILAWAAFLGFAGCTMDSIVVLQHPLSISKGETFSVGAVDIILDVAPASRPADSIHRDSIHVGVGLPAGWQVISAKACPAAHFRPARASVNLLDTNLRNRLLEDSLAACEGRAFALGSDPGVKEFLKGRSIRTNASPDSLGRPFNVKVDTVPQWFGFGGRIDVSVPAGAPADTVVDTTAIKALPVYIHLTLKAPDQDTSVRLLFFSKTGRMDTAAFSNSSNQDRGALVYRPLMVGGPVALASRPAVLPGRLALLPSAPGRWLIGVPTGALSLEIRSSSGRVLRSWRARDLSGSRVLDWDGTDAPGNPLPGGRYVLTLKDPSGLASLPFPLLR